MAVTDMLIVFPELTPGVDSGSPWRARHQEGRPYAWAGKGPPNHASRRAAKGGDVLLMRPGDSTQEDFCLVEGGPLALFAANGQRPIGHQVRPNGGFLSRLFGVLMRLAH